MVLETTSEARARAPNGAWPLGLRRPKICDRAACEQASPHQSPSLAFHMEAT